MKFICVLSLIISCVYSIPVKYDQRQDGEVNVRADLQNFVIVALVPKFDTAGTILLDALSKSLPSRKGLKNFNRRTSIPEPEEIIEVDQDGPIARVGDAFLEPKSRYQVDISSVKSNLAKLYPAEEKLDVKSETRLPEDKSSVPAISADLKLIKPTEFNGESPVPNVLPVKNNRYILAADRSGKIIEVVNVSGNENVSEIIEEVDAAQVDNVDKSAAKSQGAAVDSGLILLGAMEQCAYDQYRNSEGICTLIE